MSDAPEQTIREVACPFCSSVDTELISLFGMQMMTSQYYCRQCHTVFEAVKWTKARGPELDRSKESK